MRITKRQLKRIIKEEKARLLKESVADEIQFDELIQNHVKSIVDMYVDRMGEGLFDEDPEMFAGRSTRDEWLDQVHNASLALETACEEAIRRAIGENETMLHDGQFLDDRGHMR